MNEKQKKIEQRLNETLLPDEQICWHGAVKPFALLEEGNKQSLLLKWIITVVVAGAFSVLCLHAGSSNKISVIALAIAIALFVILMPVLEWKSLNKFQYWITDQRAIISNGGTEMYTLDLKEIDAFKIVRGKAAGDCLVLGSQIMKSANKNMRWQAAHPNVLDDTGVVNPCQGMGMAFYGLENAEEAAAFLKGKVLEIA